MSFRDNLLHLRSSANMTQEQLAMLLGVSRQSVTKWESERTYPEMDKLLKMCQIFDCSLDDLVQGDLTGTDVKATVATPGAPPADVFGYDEAMRGFAQRVSNGVMAIILGVGLSTLFFNIGVNELLGPWPETNLLNAIGVMCVFIGVLVGLALIIPASMGHSAFMKAHPFIEDFYTAEEKTRARTAFTYELIGGIALICIGVCCIIFLSDTSYEEIVGIPVLMGCIALGVRFIVHGGMTLSRTDIDQYNRTASEVLAAHEIEAAPLPAERKQEMLHNHTVEKRTSAVCGIIMIVATIIALLMLFLPIASGDPDYTHGAVTLFWLPWPIGGLLCGIATLLIKGFTKNDADNTSTCEEPKEPGTEAARD